MHVYSMCVSECMCIFNMIHLWWIKPAVSIEWWPRTPCTTGNRRRKRPLSTELPNIAWPSTDHRAALSTEVIIGQIWSHNNGITLYFFWGIIRNSSNATGNQITLNKISYSGTTKCFYSERALCCVWYSVWTNDTLFYYLPFLQSYMKVLVYTLLNALTVLQGCMCNMPLKCITGLL